MEPPTVDVAAATNLSDESLLAGLGSGEPDASAAFVRRFQHRVRRIPVPLASIAELRFIGPSGGDAARAAFEPAARWT